MRDFLTVLAVSSLLFAVGCNTANQGSAGPIPKEPMPGSPAAEMQQPGGARVNPPPAGPSS